MKLKTIALGAILVAPLMLTSALADQVTVVLNGTSTGTLGITGTNGSFQLSIIVDNGGSSISSQTWNTANFVSATLTSGTYTATYQSTDSLSFQTDSSGQLTSSIFGTLTGTVGSDSIGGTNVPFIDKFGYKASDLAFNANNDGTANDIQNDKIHTGWDNPQLPEPTTLTLLLGGLGVLGVGVLRRRT